MPIMQCRFRYLNSKNLIAAVWLIMSLFLSGHLTAQAPVNDDYANAIDVSSFINSCSANAAYTVVNATPDRNAGSEWSNSGSGPKSNVWFKFAATTDQIHIDINRGGSKGTLTYPQMALWEMDGQTEIRSENWDSVGSDIDIGHVGLTIGNTYYISVDRHSPATTGTFTLCLSDSVDYDFYEGAIDVSLFMNSCSPNAIYNTIGASADRNPGSEWNYHRNTRWFKFQATSSGEVHVKIKVRGTGSVYGNQGNTQLALWDTSGNVELASESWDAESDNVDVNYMGLTPGNMYYFSVDAINRQGTFTVCLEDRVDYDQYEGAIDVTSTISYLR